MRLTAKSRKQSFDPIAFENQGNRSQAEAIIMLGSFERELDALLSFMDEERNPAVSEAIIRRFLTAEEIHKEVREATTRIDIKMRMVASRITKSDIPEDMKVAQRE